MLSASSVLFRSRHGYPSSTIRSQPSNGCSIKAGCWRAPLTRSARTPGTVRTRRRAAIASCFRREFRWIGSGSAHGAARLAVQPPTAREAASWERACTNGRAAAGRRDSRQKFLQNLVSAWYRASPAELACAELSTDRLRSRDRSLLPRYRPPNGNVSVGPEPVLAPSSRRANSINSENVALVLWSVSSM